MVSETVSTDAKRHAETGYRHYLDGDLASAIDSYRKATDVEPGYVYAWSTLGGLYMESGDNVAARKALQNALKFESTVAALSNLGLIECQAGNFVEAVVLQQSAVDMDPQDYMCWGNLGDALRASGQDADDAFMRAAKLAEDHLETHSDDARAVAALGVYRAILGDLDTAQTLIRQAEAMDGQPGHVALLAAEALGILGKLEQARERIETARANGIAESLISSNFTFRRLGLMSATG